MQIAEAKILGIDLGTKRVGVAYSNEEMDFAFPLKVIKIQNIQLNIEKLAEDIVQTFYEINPGLVKLDQVEVGGVSAGAGVEVAGVNVGTGDGVTTNPRKIIIGDSKNFKGAENPIMVWVHELKKILQTKGFEVHLVPEFMTSAEASRFQGETKLLDASAATIILQSYLDTINSK